MLKQFLSKSTLVYNQLLVLWKDHRTHKRLGSLMVWAFLLGLILAELARHHLLPIEQLNHKIHNHFFAVELAFTLLLLTELLALIFIIPRSIAVAVGKQFEILSLILLRSAFKEFSHFEEPILWDTLSDPVFKMIADAFGAVIVFILVGIYYRILEKSKLTENKADHEQFKAFKKLTALLLLAIFVLIGWRDVWDLFSQGEYHSSFNIFYTVLIFCDIFIVLVAMRYTFDYAKIFRYSAFVLTTVFIRISLTAPPFVNAILGITAVLFVIILTLAFNRISHSNSLSSST
ncbi:MAG: hypothetical protein AAF960_30045 [Bacteroidota bacterium]